jgi:hypothetical protein
MKTYRALFVVSLAVLGAVLLVTLAEDQAPDAVLSESEDIVNPYPVEPPDMSKISVTAPDVEGYATVIGVAGAVEADAPVAVINLNARNVMTDTAGADGSFSAHLYAPPGSALIVKYEHPGGNRVRWFWQAAVSSIADATTENLNPLPGAILYVGQPAAGDGEVQPFYSVGANLSQSPRGWAGWWVSGTVETYPGSTGMGLRVLPGEPITVTGRLRVTSPALNCTGIPNYTLFTTEAGLRYIFDGQGRAEPWGMWFEGFLTTPTGLPIEHEARGEVVDVGLSLTFTHQTCVSQHAFDGSFSVVFTVPIDLPEGVYRPEADLILADVPLGSGVPVAVVWNAFAERIVGLPTLVLGDAAQPRLPLVLFGDELLNGNRGVQALEDVGHYQMVTRVLYPPRQVIVPRLDERTGQPILYQMEPYSNWLSSTDRRLPNPPHIPLLLPSGQLTIEVHKPDSGVDTLGPAPIRQSSARTPTTPGGADIDQGTGHIGDLYQLRTMDDSFTYSFNQYGLHTILVQGVVFDVYGNPYTIHSTYEVLVARTLDLDPAQLPTTPYVQGDAFAPGLHVFPPFPADVHIQVVHMPYSDPGQAITYTVSGQANRFGYFQPPTGTEIRFNSPGEFRVDMRASFTDPNGTLWAGSVAWGNVVEGPSSLIEAHGRRGMDYQNPPIDDMPAWFLNKNLPADKFGIENYYPYFSGDIHWGDETPDVPWKGDSIHSILTLKDLTGASQTIYNLLRSHFPRNRNGYRWPPVTINLTGLNQRIAIGEAPLFITTRNGIDPAVDPADIDLWGYWYGSSERPDVHVREILSEDNMGTAYWRFNDTYGYQIGEPANGDHPGDIKWEFGGLVLRTITDTNPINEYAIYSSLWVLLPHNDPNGARVTAPFQGTVGGINSGPIMTLLGEEIDMLFLPKGVRPGDVLELGNTISFSGHVGPPLDSRVEVTITSPTGVQRSRTWHANKIGWLYDPTFDFIANEVGRWTVDVFVEHDRPYLPTGVTPHSHNTGTVLGTSGRYEFYVVEPGSPRLYLTSPQPGFITWASGHIQPVLIHGVVPVGTQAIHYTIHDKGVVMAQGTVIPSLSGDFTVAYDAVGLHADFPMLSLTAHEGIWEGLSDEVTISLLAVGSELLRANTVTLIGEEVFIFSGPPEVNFGVAVPLIRR